MIKKEKLSIGRFLFELFIVFIGVYGAFELNRYQENQREQKIRENYFISFRSELGALVFNIEQNNKLIREELDQLSNYNDSLKNQPFLPLSIQFNPSLLITQAGFNADVFIQLSPELASSLVGGYDYVKSLEALATDYNQLVTNELYGFQWGDLFDRSGQLKPNFSWYQKRLQFIEDNFSFVGNMMANQAGPAVDEIIAEF